MGNLKRRPMNAVNKLRGLFSELLKCVVDIRTFSDNLKSALMYEHVEHVRLSVDVQELEHMADSVQQLMNEVRTAIPRTFALTHLDDILHGQSMDIDGFSHVNGHFLFLELKCGPEALKDAQYTALRAVATVTAQSRGYVLRVPDKKGFGGPEDHEVPCVVEVMDVLTGERREFRRDSNEGWEYVRGLVEDWEFCAKHGDNS